MSSAEQMPTQVALALARIEAKLDVALARVEPRPDRAEAGHTNHEGRLSAIEKKLWILAGAAMAGGAGISQFLGG